MRLNDATRAAAAVDAVTGEVFRDGWSRIRGSMQGLHASKQKQMVRAAAGHRAAVFKAIRGGGTHNKSQLSNQLEYLTTKSTHIVDSSGFLDWKSRLDRGEIKDLTERFAKRWDGGFKPKLGQTTHLLMSFPIGTRGEDVRDIATDVQVADEEGQRQQEMNFADQGEMQLEERDDGDRDRLDLAVDDLGGLEDQLKQGELGSA